MHNATIVWQRVAEFLETREALEASNCHFEELVRRVSPDAVRPSFMPDGIEGES